MYMYIYIMRWHPVTEYKVVTCITIKELLAFQWINCDAVYIVRTATLTSTRLGILVQT